MKIRNIISAAIMGVVLSSTPACAEYSIGAIVTADYLNVRKYPSKDAEIIDILSKGEYIDALDSGNPDWNRISFGIYSGYVYNAYLTGGSAPEEIENYYFKAEQVEKKQEEASVQTNNSQSLTRVIALDDFRYAGVVNWNGWNWTYYTMSMFPGSTSTPCPGRWVNDEGFVCDPDGYIILASVDLAPYTTVETPFGYMGKVYDTGCPSGILDVYTNW